MKSEIRGRATMAEYAAVAEATKLADKQVEGLRRALEKQGKVANAQTQSSGKKKK